MATPRCPGRPGRAVRKPSAGQAGPRRSESATPEEHIRRRPHDRSGVRGLRGGHKDRGRKSPIPGRGRRTRRRRHGQADRLPFCPQAAWDPRSAGLRWPRRVPRNANRREVAAEHRGGARPHVGSDRPAVAIGGSRNPAPPRSEADRPSQSLASSVLRDRARESLSSRPVGEQGSEGVDAPVRI